MGSFFPRRTIHLDFHTGPDVPDVAVDFDPGRFAATFAAAHVDSVTVFAKCHHGLLYYDTDRPERHPGLARDLDLLKQQVDALHAVGIRAPVYLSVQVDEHAATTHPEWVAMDADLKLVRWGEPSRAPGGAFVAGWHILDMSSPYQQLLVDQTTEVLEHLGVVDGLFLDMCWDQPSSTRWAIEGALEAGFDPETEAGRSAYARANALQYMRRFQDLAAPYLSPDVASGVWFNSRPKTNLHVEAALLKHVEVESLPTGGWGYAYLPYVARFVRPLGLPTLSHTGRFHRSWGDNASLKPQAALDYETSQILSLGLTNGVGDLLHPRGVPNAAVYERIGAAYAHVEACEPHQEGTEPVAEVAVVVDPELGDAPGAAGIGAVRVLQQLRHQFAIVPPTADLAPYRLVLVPETTVVDEALRATLSAHVERGGALVLVGDALVGDDGEVSVPEAGVSVHGPSPFANTFLRSVSPDLPDLGQDTVVYDRGLRMTPSEGTEVLVGTVEPYFDRTWAHFSGHSYTAPDQLSQWAAVTRRGQVVAVAAPLLLTYGRLGNEVHRQVLGHVLDLLLPRPALRAGGPLHLETTVRRGPDRTVVHLLSYLPTRVGSGLGAEIDLVDDPFPLVDVDVEVACDTEPRTATLEPAGTPLPLAWADGVARTTVTVLDGHAMIVLRS
ncbi:beta-galactosidase trimerization domain-containing protein [Microlunatus flavus]|uniref:Beta-galactosidase trimerisation domain-containing protein n=1 Tax=Microlunatus flavus TaxID=1036181 RepID=A0A1H9B363_9ACTN|nr:beta-galactosidase trimerization domain-containing protein [Microlunatus flavus]SEP82658.1 Beta-galactosidase trimerisation domain-containing protein [Microlunatus flavus]